MKKNLTRIAAAAVALAVAGPALPCGVTQSSAQATVPAPPVAQAPRADPKAQAKVAKKPAADPKKTTVAAKN